MQNYKQKRYKFLFAFAFTFVTTGLFAQSNTPNVSHGIDPVLSPIMPTIESPTIGEGFYVPGNNQNPIYTNTSKNKDTKKAQNSSTEKKSDSIKNNNIKQQSKITDNLLSSLTASDISSLGNMGFLNNLYDSNNSNTTSSTNVLLQNVLTELQKIKETQNTNIVNTTVTSKTEAKSVEVNNIHQPSLLRFSVNGYNILETCRTVYISKLQTDQTFILTGDRKYQSDNKCRTETFYLLFKNSGVNEGQTTYSVAASVSQDYQNEYSFLYQLANKNDLSATRTGNLIILKTNDESWKLDLLLDLGE